MKCEKIKNNHAFTLIETVVALVIAGILLSVIYYGFSLSVRISRSGNNVVIATNAAKTVYNNFLNKLEQINLEDEYSEDGNVDNLKYTLKAKKVDFNINNKFDITIKNCYKIIIKIFKDGNVYDFEYFLEK